MKTFFKEKSWLFTLSLALMASSAWTSASAQDTESKVETKVTIIKRTSNENVEVFTPTWEHKARKDRSSKNYSWSWSSSGDKTQTSNKPKLGVMLKGSESGTVILRTLPNTAAEEAGLLAGDKILRIDGKSTESIEGLIAIITEHKVGDKISIVYVRDGKKQTSSATLKASTRDYYSNHRTNFQYYNSNNNEETVTNESPCEQLRTIYGKPFLGVYLSNPHQENGDGARLSSIIEKTGASKAQLKADDKIKRMDNTAVNSTKEAIKFIQSKKPGDIVNLHLLRDGQMITIKATLGSWADSPNYQSRVRILGEACALQTIEDIEENRPPSAPQESAQEEDNAREEANNKVASFEQELVMEVFPNPTSDVVNIKFEGEKGALTVNIISLDGKSMFTKTVQDVEGTYNDQFDLSQYPSGVYIVNLKQNDKQLSQQVVVE